MALDIEILDEITTTTYEYDFGIVELTTYFSKIKAGNIQLLEHEEMKWMKADDIDQLDWAPADIPAIKIIKEKKGNKK